MTHQKARKWMLANPMQELVDDDYVFQSRYRANERGEIETTDDSQIEWVPCQTFPLPEFEHLTYNPVAN